MIKIGLSDVGKRFNYDWIFRHLSTTIESGHHYLIQGNNGSGKSTLLKVISGVVSPNEGKISYEIDGQAIEVDQIYRHLNICTPYLQLIEEFTLDEMLQFHQSVKPLKRHFSGKEMSEFTEIHYQHDKALHLFSSGMKQRIKLALALLSDSPLLLLDEPLSNLDANGIAWYKRTIREHQENRVICVCSNQVEDEYFFCDKNIDLAAYKN
ncbi:ATP-binding cassette domain-containing protein [bacterium SCSIO 12741]|nr:ATP-binding cassette domain-containing protein [bacterium SCSIO 12741]